MIFVTVGTHEQPFNRLIEWIDQMKREGLLTDESVFLQIGYSTYIPKYCQYKDFISPQEMDYFMQKADRIITHGGPSSFIGALQHGKEPIVVPRRKKFNEHINDHQLVFCNELVKRGFPIKLVQEKGQLNEVLFRMNKASKNDKAFQRHNEEFNNSLESMIDSMFHK
ncbi:glycosyltransferase [Lactiplantibacillus plantarum]|uniref:glycosyltransferase n=1 Tax=Lactobacillaceae TaxID=33958 RepID=UPI001A2A4480|nr:multidrug MFS transporter [Lactobacillus sp. CRM56-2]